MLGVIFDTERTASERAVVEVMSPARMCTLVMESAVNLACVVSTDLTRPITVLFASLLNWRSHSYCVGVRTWYDQVCMLVEWSVYSLQDHEKHRRPCMKA